MLRNPAIRLRNAFGFFSCGLCYPSAPASSAVALATSKLCRQGGRGIRSGPGPGGWQPARPQFHADRRWRGDFTCGGENGECRFLPLARAAMSLLIRLFVPGIGSRVCAALEALAGATGRLHCARASFQVSSGASR
jgi:hypothetical protein